MSNIYKKKLRTETFFINPADGLNEGQLKSVDLVVTEQVVASGSYPAQKFIATTGKKYGTLWSDNPWSDIIGSDPLGGFFDLQRFLDEYYYLDTAVIYLRGEVSYNSDGTVETDGHGNPVYTNRLAKIYEASRHVDNAPATFLFNVFENNGTTPIIDATATVRLGGKETVIDYDIEKSLYTGEVYGIGEGILTIEATGFDNYELPVTVSPYGVIDRKILQDPSGDGYVDEYINIVMVPTTP